MPRPDDLMLIQHTSAEAAELMDALCEVYADAYGAVPGEDIREKSSAFRERAIAAMQGVNYSLVTAQVGAELVGRVVPGATGGFRREDRLAHGGALGDQGAALISIMPPFTWEAIMDSETVDELIRTLELTREDAKKMPCLPRRAR